MPPVSERRSGWLQQISDRAEVASLLPDETQGVAIKGETRRGAAVPADTDGGGGGFDGPKVTSVVALVVGAAFATEEVAIPLYPPIRMRLADPVFGLPEFQRGPDHHSVSVDTLVVFIPLAHQIRIGNPLPPRFGVFQMLVLIFFTGDLGRNRPPIRPAETPRSKHLFWTKIRSEFRKILKYKFLSTISRRHDIII